MPKHVLDSLDDNMFSHILERNKIAKTALLDWAGLGPNKKKVIDFLETTDLEVIKLWVLIKKYTKNYLKFHREK